MEEKVGVMEMGKGGVLGLFCGALKTRLSTSGPSVLARDVILGEFVLF